VVDRPSSSTDTEPTVLLIVPPAVTVADELTTPVVPVAVPGPETVMVHGLDEQVCATAALPGANTIPNEARTTVRLKFRRAERAFNRGRDSLGMERSSGFGGARMTTKKRRPVTEPGR
jgi:hypothetical protein